MDRISDVRVETQGDATRVLLMGLDRPVFTAFAQTNPDRVVVDLASVELEEPDEILVDDGRVRAVQLSSFSTGLGDPMARVEIGLTESADYDVTPTEDGLEIRIGAEAGIAAEDPWASPSEGSESEAEDPWASSPSEDPWAVSEAEPALESAPLVEAPDLSEAAAASALLAVDAQRVGDGSLVHLRADGMLEAESFTLEDPARLVIDLPRVESRVAESRVEVGSPVAQSIRLGVHADHVRVVIDAGDAEDAFDGRRLMPAADGLWVALGSEPAVDQALAQALQADPEPAAAVVAEAPLAEPEESVVEALPQAEPEVEPLLAEGVESEATEPFEAATEPEPFEVATEESPPAEAPVMIYGLEFDTQQGRDRIVVLGERPFDYLIYEPDPETVVLSIEGAVIDPEVAQRIAPEPGGPVSLVTAFEQPDVEISEVRVVVKRAADLKPAVSRRGSLLVLDFARDGSIAATPPILEELPEEPLLQPAGEATAQVAGELPLAATEARAEAPPAAGTPLAAAEPAAAAEPVGQPLGSAPAAAAAVPASLEPAASIGVLQEGGLFDGKEYTGQRISLDFKDVEIADVLRLIAEVSDLNVIAGDEVAGRVTIRLVDVPWDQALDVILLTKSLGFMRVGNVLRIAPAEVIKAEEEARLEERRALEKLEDLVVKLQPVNYADVKDIEKMVKKLLSERGTVNIDQRTNTLIIKDIPSVIDEATALIKAIDTQTPQVMIEAKIVEASLDFSREFGSVWSFGAQPLTDPFNAALGPNPSLGNDAFRLNTNATSLGNNAQFLNPITANPTALFNIAGFLADENLNLELQLQAAEVNGDGKVISSPRVVTLDNSEAEIEQGVSIPFQTFENGDAQLEFVDAVLKLKVTPHITADKSIIMDVEVSRNAPDDSVFTLTGSPAIAKNEVETETLVKDGQTLVLGGIYVINKSDRQSRVPYLHRIPLIGAAFRSDETSDSRKELLIFVTPHIVVTEPLAS